ncbi:V-type ATP synthase subunit I [Clostridium uliginosum]|uniref:V/A-type H+-transporting ATPase subunit I n=1 Tax=Clostridium uliginosum TaxID=119641 RepID=A0A1I1LYK5_9CLOT|nr:V-type ATP synthase subunit I [Clostridium uliginosum]SFC78327.1 V/A-type H+-transporting ATPase subunit I [Clostridium uliginosum]
MAIVKMNKFTLLSFESKKDELLEKLQAFSEVEFINLQDENIQEKNEVLKELDKDEIDSEISRWQEQLSKAKFALQFLKDYVPKQSLIKSLRAEKLSLTIKELEEEVLNNNWESIYDKVKQQENKLAMLDNEKTKLQGNVQSLKPYENFNAPLGSLNELKMTAQFLGSIANQYEDALKNDLNDCYLEIISKDNQDTYFFLLAHGDKKEEVEEVLRGFGFSPFKTDEKVLPLKLIQDYNERISIIESEKFLVKEELAGYEEDQDSLKLACEYYYNLVNRKAISNNFLKTDKTTLFQGWVPTEKNDRFIQIAQEVLGEDYYLNFEEVKEEEIDDVPIKLKNNDLNTSFESVTEMYSLPKYNDIDPTPLLTPFYLVFFGMMVADAGYGLVMLLATLGALKFFNLNEGQKKMTKFFMYLSFPTIMFGLAYGSIFGDVIKFKGLIDTNADVMTILVISIVFGVIQIFFGLGIKAYMLIKAGKILDAFYDVGSWVITLVSIGVFGLSGMLGLPDGAKKIAIGAMIFGMIVIVLTQGRTMKSKGGKLAQGLYELYGITSYIGDLVSYTRLMAIGLSGASIAGAINMIMKMIPGIGFFIAAPLIFVLGQTVNLLLSLLSGYVHTLRLTYVEYFSKFYDGEGRAFEPFKTQNEYINLKRE